MDTQPEAPTEDQLWTRGSRLVTASERKSSPSQTTEEDTRSTLSRVWPDEQDTRSVGYSLYEEEETGLAFWVRDKSKAQLAEDDETDGWEDEFPVMGECDIPKVEVIVDDLLIKGGIHVWAGMFESYKTVAAIELSAAILHNRKVFDLFEVRKQYPVLYLCPDMPPELFQEYTRPFGLMNEKEFRWMKPGGDAFHAIDSPMLGRAARGRLLILDTMLDYAQIQKAFESGEWIAFFAKLRRLINVCGCVAIVMLVHPTKTGAKSNTIDPSEYLKDSVTFGGKIDVGFGFSKLPKTSQVMVERIKGRGFKKQQFSFSIAYLDDDGNSNLDRGRFPFYKRPGEAGKKEDHVKTGAPGDSLKQQKIQFARTVDGSMQTKADAVNEKFGSRHSKSTLHEWLSESIFQGAADQGVFHE